MLGKDEMNLAEFPITLLTDRVPKNQKEAVYQDVIYDALTGRALTRKLTISAGNYGLTTAVDDEVILALIQLTKQKNHFTQRKVEFSRSELIQMLGWQRKGASYERLLQSFQKWTSVYLQYENAWRDNSTKTWKTVGFHIIDKFELNDSRHAGDQTELLPSHIVWNEVIFESFQAGYLKPLDYDLCVGLSNSTAKRMYRFLDKRFHHKPDWTFDLKEFAHEHIGLGRNYEGQIQLRRKLQPGIAELERVGFLEPLPAADRFRQNDGRWMIRLVRRGADPRAVPGREPAPESPEPSPATGTPPARPSPPAAKGRPAGQSHTPAVQPGPGQQLMDRGVTAITALRLIKEYEPEAILRQIEIFDWRVDTRDQSIQKNPAGFLVQAIQFDYAPPPGFVPKAERQRQQEQQQARQRQEAEALRRKAQTEARERAEDEAVRAYRASLTPEQLRQLEAEALARANSETRQAYETTPHARYQEALLFSLTNDHLRRLVRAGTIPCAPP
jgi:Replication initiator protein A